ncbi:hypothetical protein CPB83DRAFT_865903 [Crepidotus variabilis]|uniref:Pre-mRNA polyadenylation factor Fip1 domain-containing protein n=1 Tax=Crepidotus variabilis TaxID=179855 RepID=A0A9P6EVC4_9AGAR|nr:hypothetical protein CPB83DRAFT_865903 [Crepidotus variabilis]
MEPLNRSLDLRNQNKPQPTRNSSIPLPANLPTAPRGRQNSRFINSTLTPSSAAGLSLTTEYTPISRGAPPPTQIIPPTEALTSIAAAIPPQEDAAAVQPDNQEPDDGIDTSTLPPATAPTSAPTIDPGAIGIFDGRSILEVDLTALADKPWRRPGSDLSEWFNYGFDELSWEAYCHIRRDVGDLASVLKANVITFSAMPEDQLMALPPEVRTMVMQGTATMMNNAGNAGMMGPGVMMDMSGMMGMGGMGMSGDMAAAMGGGMMQGIMSGDGGIQGQQPGGVAGGVPVQGQEQVGMMQDGSGFGPGQAGGQGMMNMGMGGDFVMQDQNPMMQQQMYMDAPTVPAAMQAGRGTAIPAGPAQFRGRAAPAGAVPRGRGFAPRGRGRGSAYGDAPPTAPARPASPLPPNVPTGPRNQNKYKDRDGNAPAVDGLDYGGGRDAPSRRTSSGEPEERVSSRKRRSSPGLDDIRGSKRR